VEVDLAAVRHNVAAFADLVAPAALCAVVKADGYGHGDVPVATAALDAGARWLAVALVEEGIRLREAGIEAPILVLSEPPVEDAATMIEWELRPSVYRPEFVATLDSLAGFRPVPVHLKLDTGMHRVGADPPEAFAVARTIAASPRLELEGVWTHFAVAEDDADFTGAQILALSSFLDGLAAEGIKPRLVHAANTAGTLFHAEARRALVRVGLGIYGLEPTLGAGGGLDLRPAMRVVSAVTMVRRLPAGARPSYGRVRPMPEPGTVATVPVGYADGLSRRLGDVGAEVLIGGRRRPLAGAVTMDQIVVDVGRDPVAVGDEVVILGEQDGEVITADQWAGKLGTINYEVVCTFGPRLPRRYLG
jgi:alanine racemase